MDFELMMDELFKLMKLRLIVGFNPKWSKEMGSFNCSNFPRPKEQKVVSNHRLPTGRYGHWGR